MATTKQVRSGQAWPASYPRNRSTFDLALKDRTQTVGMGTFRFLHTPQLFCEKVLSKVPLSQGSMAGATADGWRPVPLFSAVDDTEIQWMLQGANLVEVMPETGNTSSIGLHVENTPSFAES